MRTRLLRLRFLLIPSGSRRERIYHSVRVALSIWREAGIRAVYRQFPRLLRTSLLDCHPSGDQLAVSLAYNRWIKKHEPNYFGLARQRKLSKEFSYQPLITIISPVYNPAPKVLKDTIKSVLAQTYHRWELCLVNGNSDRPGVKDILDNFARRDPRIKVKHLEKNLGISGNSNEGLNIAQGVFVSLLDHDDLLAPDNLFEIVRKLNQDPSADIIYYDEDKVSEDGKHRAAPWFKPGAWSPDLLLSTNYLMHSVIRRSVLDSTGGFDPEMDGAQDWDLSLRMTEKTRKIVHIPRVLYHWRQIPGSAASDANAKPWAFKAQRRCIEAHLNRLGVESAQVVFPSLGLVHILWPIANDKVSIVIPTKDKVGLLKSCLSSIFEKTTYPNYEIILVDSGSTEPETFAYYETLGTDTRVLIEEVPGPFNYHKVNNLGARRASGDIFIFLNNDTKVLESGWLEELAGWCKRPEVGVVGAKLLRPDGTIQHAGIIMGLAGHGSHVFEGGREHLYGPFGSTEWYRNYMAVTGACMAIRREVFEFLGGFDETYQVGYGDIDICLRAIKAGYRVVYTPFARILHREGASRGFSQPPSDTLRASVKMFAQVQAGDPFFNPNLSYWQRLPAIAPPDEKRRESCILKIMYDFDLIGREDIGGTDPERWRIRMSDGPGSTQVDGDHRKRILIVTHELSRSGAPIILWKVAKYLAGKGFYITTLSPLDGPLHQAYIDEGMQVRVIPSILEDARIILNYMNGHDLLFANTILAFRTIHAAKAFDKPCIWWVHESTFGQEIASSNPSAAQAFTSTNAVVFPSRATADLYKQFSSQGNYYPIHLGLDLQVPCKQEIGAPFARKAGMMYIMSVASIESRKGQDILLQGIKKLPADIAAKMECYLIGRILSKSEKQYCQKITRLAKRMGNVHILGDIPSESVKSYLQAADVFVLPSRDEALPLSLIEAMAFGKAIIATKVGGTPEIIDHEVNGLLVENEDAQGIADSLLRLYQDRRLIGQLGERARMTFQERLSFSKFAEQMFQLVNRMAGNSQT